MLFEALVRFCAVGNGLCGSRSRCQTRSILTQQTLGKVFWEAATVYWGSIGRVEKKMETIITGYIGVMGI